MDDLTFPYKGERGTRFGVYSSNTHRRSWRSLFDIPHTEVSIQHHNQSVFPYHSHFIGAGAELSVNKRKRWEVIDRLDRLMSDTKPSDEFPLYIVHKDQHNKGSRHFIVNGKRKTRLPYTQAHKPNNWVTDAPWYLPPDDDVVVNSHKTISRRRRRAEERRAQDYWEELEYDKVPDNAEYWVIQHPKTAKQLVKPVGPSNGSTPPTGKQRRKQRKQRMLDLINAY